MNPLPARLIFSVLGSIALLSWANVTNAASLTPLGDLPGGGFFSEAHAISADGTTVVGWGSVSANYQAFRWTRQTGMVGLSNVPGGPTFNSFGTAVSGDGSVVAGYTYYDDNRTIQAW